MTGAEGEWIATKFFRLPHEDERGGICIILAFVAAVLNPLLDFNTPLKARLLMTREERLGDLAFIAAVFTEYLMH